LLVNILLKMEMLLISPFADVPYNINLKVVPQEQIFLPKVIVRKVFLKQLKQSNLPMLLMFHFI